MRIIAIDPSLRSTGIYDLNKGVGTIICWSIKKKIDKNDALARILENANALFMEGADYLIIEDYAYSRAGRSGSVTALAEVCGVLKATARLYDIFVVEIPSTTWKAVVGFKTMGKGTKAKDLAYCEKVKELFEKEFISSDTADAYMLFLAFKKIVQVKGRRTAGAMKIYEKIKDRVQGLEISKE